WMRALPFAIIMGTSFAERLFQTVPITCMFLLLPCQKISRLLPAVTSLILEAAPRMDVFLNLTATFTALSGAHFSVGAKTIELNPLILGQITAFLFAVVL